MTSFVASATSRPLSSAASVGGEAHRRHEDEVGLRFRDGAQRGVRAAEDRRAERTPQRLRPFPARPHRKGRHAERLRVRANDVART